MTKKPPFDTKNFALAREFIVATSKLHHEISRRYKELFAAIGARMWPGDDMQSSKTWREPQVKNDTNFGYYVYFTLKHAKVVPHPLTVLDAYPEAKRNVRRYNKFLQDVNKVWEEHGARQTALVRKYKRLIKFQAIVARDQKLSLKTSTIRCSPYAAYRGWAGFVVTFPSDDRRSTFQREIEAVFGASAIETESLGGAGLRIRFDSHQLDAPLVMKYVRRYGGRRVNAAASTVHASMIVEQGTDGQWFVRDTLTSSKDGPYPDRPSAERARVMWQQAQAVAASSGRWVKQLVVLPDANKRTQFIREMRTLGSEVRVRDVGNNRVEVSFDPSGSGLESHVTQLARQLGGTAYAAVEASTRRRRRSVRATSFKPNFGGPELRTRFNVGDRVEFWTDRGTIGQVTKVENEGGGAVYWVKTPRGVDHASEDELIRASTQRRRSVRATDRNGQLVTVEFFDSESANRFQDEIESNTDGEVSADKIGSKTVVVEVLDSSLFDVVRRVATKHRGSVKGATRNASTSRPISCGFGSIVGGFLLRWAARKMGTAAGAGYELVPTIRGVPQYQSAVRVTAPFGLSVTRRRSARCSAPDIRTVPYSIDKRMRVGDAEYWPRQIYPKVEYAFPERKSANAFNKRMLNERYHIFSIGTLASTDIARLKLPKTAVAVALYINESDYRAVDAAAKSLGGVFMSKQSAPIKLATSDDMTEFVQKVLRRYKRERYLDVQHRDHIEKGLRRGRYVNPQVLHDLNAALKRGGDGEVKASARSIRAGKLPNGRVVHTLAEATKAVQRVAPNVTEATLRKWFETHKLLRGYRDPNTGEIMIPQEHLVRFMRAQGMWTKGRPASASTRGRAVRASEVPDIRTVPFNPGMVQVGDKSYFANYVYPEVHYAFPDRKSGNAFERTARQEGYRIYATGTLGEDERRKANLTKSARSVRLYINKADRSHVERLAQRFQGVFMYYHEPRIKLSSTRRRSVRAAFDDGTLKFTAPNERSAARFVQEIKRRDMGKAMYNGTQVLVKTDAVTAQRVADVAQSFGLKPAASRSASTVACGKGDPKRADALRAIRAAVKSVGGVVADVTTSSLRTYVNVHGLSPDGDVHDVGVALKRSNVFDDVAVTRNGFTAKNKLDDGSGQYWQYVMISRKIAGR